jgi:predicted P-loop ATPase
VLDPGCQADMVPVLVGPQGLRKSSAVAAIAPAFDYFTEVDLSDKSADLSRIMRGKVIGEIADMNGLTSRDMQAIKAFITVRFDKWVPKYKEFSTIAARRLVFVGTSNPQQFLDDETGERRWLPAQVMRVCDIDAIVRDRGQLWAEGAAAYHAYGIQWAAAEQLARPEHAEYKVGDAWQDAIEGWLATDATRTTFTAADVLGGAILLDKPRMDRSAQNRAAKILRRLGCRNERVVIGGARSWRWVRG